LIFSKDRDKLRQQYVDVWQKANASLPLEPLETIIADVIRDHPEYHTLLDCSEAALNTDYYPEHGQTNPFLHMGMHIALREQVATDRPAGITAITRKLILRYRDSHEMEHQMMESLGETLWNAQVNNTAPDESAYLEALRKL